MTKETSPVDSILRRTALKAAGIGAGLSLGIGTVAADDDGEGEDEDPSDTAYGAEIQMRDPQLVVDHGGFSADAYAVVAVENVGNVASGPITITADWFDESDGRVDDDWEVLPSLGAGETWLAHVRSLTDPEEIADFEVAGEFETGYPRTPKGMAVAGSEYVIDDDEIVGTAENTRDSDLDRIEAIAKIYDENGTVLGGGSTMEFDLPAERDWSFEIRTPRLPEVVDDAPDYEVREPVDHDVALKGDTYLVEDVT